MKKTIITLSILVGSFNALCQRIDRTNVYFDYGKHQLTENSIQEISALKKRSEGKKIKQITLVGHTDHDGSQAYNMTLSENRVKSVRNKLNDIHLNGKSLHQHYKGENKPVATNQNESGKQKNRRVEIVVEYEDDSILENFTEKFQTFNVNPKINNDIQLDAKGTVIHIPKGALIHQDGSPVTESVQLQYREFKNSADMAFSQIPMMINHNCEEYAFNSSGMFEIRALENQQELKIKPGANVTIDYAIAKQNQDIHFFKLDDNSLDWTLDQEISKNNSTSQINPQIQDNRNNDTSVVKVEIINGRLVQDNMVAMEEQIIVDGKIVKGAPRPVNQNAIIQQKNLPKSFGTLLAEGSSDPGHTYPSIIKGLNCKDFGVYNCDQMYRIENLTFVKANYVDENGAKIENGHVLSLIDLSYNGAFSFSPNNFTCNGKGKNVLALFTKDKKLYLLDAESFTKMKIQTGGTYTFPMKNMTAEITSSDELAAYLKLK